MMNGFTTNAKHGFNSWKWSNLAWSSSNSVTIYFCILPLCGPANSSSRKTSVLILTLGKWQNAFDNMCYCKNWIYFWELKVANLSSRFTILLSVRVGSLVTNGADPEGNRPPKTCESNFIHHKFLQSGKQHSR